MRLSWPLLAKFGIEAATIAYIEAGEVYFERDFNQQGEETTPLRNQGRPGRSARKWFSYDIPVDAARPLKLIATYHGEERATRTFEILVDGTRIGEQRIERHRPGSPTKSFFNAEYAIPAAVVQGKQKVTVRFQATSGNKRRACLGCGWFVRINKWRINDNNLGVILPSSRV